MRHSNRWTKGVGAALTIALAFWLGGCVEPIHPYQGIAPGTWRAELFLDANKSIKLAVDDRRQKVNTTPLNDIDVLPFLFDVRYDDDTTWHIVIRNGEEHIISKDIHLARTKGDADKHMTVDFPHYDTHIEAILKEGVLQGHFVVHYKDNYRIPFVAKHGESHRFNTSRLNKPTDFSGRWAVTFTDDGGSYPAIGLFEQDGEKVTGTFLTETGDYRFLSGVADSNKLWLSTFDGAHAFLFRGRLTEDRRMTGIFRSGHKYQSRWEAHRDSEARLKNADELTSATGEEVSFTFPDARGQEVTFPSPTSDKIKIVQIMGTWCPNCFDESRYLKNLLSSKRYRSNIEAIGIAFERYRKDDKSRAAIQRYEDKMELPYPILHGGYHSKKEAAERLPWLSEITSYPTLVVLDQNNNVRYVHTGFSGPATPDFVVFKKKMASLLDGLIDEMK